MSTKQNTGLRKLKKHEIERLRDRFVASTKQGDSANRQALYEALQVKTRIDLPLGELANPEMRGLVQVWSMTKTFVHGEITDQHQFNAQGLEGLVSINDVPLGQALLAAIKTGLYRIEIFVPRGGLRPALLEENERSDDEEVEDLEEHSLGVSSE